MVRDPTGPVKTADLPTSRHATTFVDAGDPQREVLALRGDYGDGHG